MAQLDAPSDWRPGGRGFNPRRGRQHSFVEIDHEIFSTVILPLPLIQEGQLSVSGLAWWVKILADDILKYFSYVCQKTDYDIPCKLSPLETICMNCQGLFSGENQKTIINL